MTNELRSVLRLIWRGTSGPRFLRRQLVLAVLTAAAAVGAWPVEGLSFYVETRLNPRTFAIAGGMLILAGAFLAPPNGDANRPGIYASVTRLGIGPGGMILIRCVEALAFSGMAVLLSLPVLALAAGPSGTSFPELAVSAGLLLLALSHAVLAWSTAMDLLPDNPVAAAALGLLMASAILVLPLLVLPQAHVIAALDNPAARGAVSGLLHLAWLVVPLGAIGLRAEQIRRYHRFQEQLMEELEARKRR